MNGCRGCAESALDRVVDLGSVPAADHFPPALEALRPAETSHGLAMDLCRNCGLAQLADDDTVADEPRGVEPQALKDQAEMAIERVAAAGWLRGRTVREFGSPHGGTWIPLMNRRGFDSTPLRADVVLDCFGIMHEPNQRHAFAQRARLTKSTGVLLLQYHSLTTIVEQGQWNSLRHGHFAYYSLTTLTRLLGAVGMRAVTAWEFDLYGGTVLIAAVHGQGAPEESVRRILAKEAGQGIGNRLVVGRLQRDADTHAQSMRRWLEGESSAGRTVFAYGAASRAVALFSRAGIDSTLLRGVADASPSKQGRRMPGTDLPIVSPKEMLEAGPDRVLLTLPDLLPEVSTRFPELAGKWQVDGDYPSTNVDDERRKSA